MQHWWAEETSFKTLKHLTGSVKKTMCAYLIGIGCVSSGNIKWGKLSQC